MSIRHLIQQMRERYDGWSARPSADESAVFLRAFGALPSEVIELYEDHDGTATLPRRGDAWLPVRLMPMREAIETQPALGELTASVADVGRIVWLWSDDNSNYLGVYTTGRLTGWLVKLNHEDPILTPAYRSVGTFLVRLLAAAPGTAPQGQAAIDLVMVPQDVPVIVDDPQHVDTDRMHARTLAEMYSHEADEDRRRVLSMSSICLTPVADTGSIAPFLREPDMWTPETAVLLMELRRFGGASEEVERLAREGSPNGDSAAMRLLVRLGNSASNAAIARLQGQLSGQKLRCLEQWVRLRDRMQPPRWE